MKFEPKDPPRKFRVGKGGRIGLSDCGRVELAPDEQVTFVTESGAEYDVARKSWGYYATPSLNGRLLKFGLRAVLGKNREGRFYLYLVESGREADFERYAEEEEQEIVCWMDNDRDLGEIERRMKGTSR